METTEQVTIMSTEEVAVINASRTVLKAVAERARFGNDTQNGGIVYEVATQAEWGAFRVLSCARTYMGVEISDDLIHNRP